MAFSPTTKTKLRSLVAVCAGLALLAAACSESGDDPDLTDPPDGVTTAAPPAGEPEPEIPTAPGFDGETITLGYMGLYSERLLAIGNPLEQGSQIYWNWLNDQGGVAGKYKVHLMSGNVATLNDNNSPDPTIDYERLKDKVAMFAFIFSTPATQALLPSLKADNIVAVPGSVAGAWAGEKLLLPSGSAYEYEMINLADWFVNESGLSTGSDVHCVAYMNDQYGRDTLEGLEYVMKELGLELGAKESVTTPGLPDYPAIIEALQDADCTVVYAITLPLQQDALLAEASEVGFEPNWLGAYPSYLNAVAREKPDNYEKFYVTVDGPALVSDPDDTDVPGMAKFAERFAQYADAGTIPNTYHLGGYFQAIAVHALLEKAVELGDLSRDGMVEAMAQLREVDTDGLTADNYVYGLPEDRQPTSGTRIFKFNFDVKPDHLEEVGEINSDYNDGFDLF